MFIKITTAILLAATTLFTFCAAAQIPVLKITHVVKSDRTVAFEFDKTDPGTYTVVLNFTQLDNSSARARQELTVKGYAGPLLILRPENKDKQIGFGYKYTSIRGKLNPSYDPQFVYLLPYKDGTTVKAAESSFFNATYFGSTTPDDWKYYRFFTSTQDSVTAIRKGIIVDIKMDVADLSEEYSFSSTNNFVKVEHIDGTIATYSGFKKASSVLKLGQIVYPGDVLGSNAQHGADKRWNIGLSITYLKSLDFEASRKQGLKESKSLYGFVFPYFHTKEALSIQLKPQNDYIVAQTAEIVRKEFTKKELKQNIR